MSLLFPFKKFDTPRDISEYCQKNNCKPHSLQIRKKILKLYGYETPDTHDEIYGCIIDNLNTIYLNLYGDSLDKFGKNNYAKIKLPDPEKDYEIIYNIARDYPKQYKCLVKYLDIKEPSKLTTLQRLTDIVGNNWNINSNITGNDIGNAKTIGGKKKASKKTRKINKK